ncbi:MAG TPA: HD domain-containing protein [Patescibacteria group bacterium]|nr:HD domain-containing protein [Patescibacteria group bacterium]
MKQPEIQEILTFLQRSSKLKSVPRFSASLKSDGDSVAEHSWRLALMVFIIGNQCKVDVNLNKAIGIALLHDLAEAKTGDFDAYEFMNGTRSLDEKRVLEKSAMDELTGDISFGNWICYIWEEFEYQKTVEAKFVKALDRIEAFLHIAEHGVKAYIPKEFHSDYADKAVKAFDEASNHFPEIKDLLEMVKKDLKQQFEAVGVKWTVGTMQG